MTCGPGRTTDATVSTRTRVTDQPKRLAMAAQTPAIMAPFLGRWSVFMPPVCRVGPATTSGLPVGGGGVHLAAVAFAFSFVMNRVSASSSDNPFVSGTTRSTKTNDSAANNAYMP
ncbi:MAG: hypothetical protein JWM50_870 [Microbacteriaceae bacterium]|jgi:hypothetical protein|nr:hypothetical protein [Microbacteriaceae bacterium]